MIINNNQTDNLSPTADEVLNELLLLNSRLMMENIALKISFNKLKEAVEFSKETATVTLED